jgi:hypothetical protein
MPTISVGALSFTFDDDWQASKYDDWSFYRHRFQRIRNEVKAVDILAISPERTVWFIEVKDYRRHPRSKPTTSRTRSRTRYSTPSPRCSRPASTATSPTRPQSPRPR